MPYLAAAVQVYFSNRRVLCGVDIHSASGLPCCTAAAEPPKAGSFIILSI